MMTERDIRKKGYSNIAWTWVLSIAVVALLIFFSRYAIDKDKQDKDRIYNTENQLNETIVTTEETQNKASTTSGVVDESWKLILVNPKNALDENYKVTLVDTGNGYMVDQRIYNELKKMFDDAKEDGVYLYINSAYRTREEQKRLFEEKISSYVRKGYSREMAKAMTLETVAEVGHSEHETGLALDIIGDKVRTSNDEAYEWLQHNAHIYGFIMRYPANKESLTGTSYEPWHYRYVGTKAAEEIYSQNICMEEYV